MKVNTRLYQGILDGWARTHVSASCAVSVARDPSEHRRQLAESEDDETPRFVPRDLPPRVTEADVQTAESLVSDAENIASYAEGCP